MAMQFRVMVEIEGSSPDTFKIGFEFSDEEGSGIEFYSNHDLPEDVSEKLGALAIDFINKIGDLVLHKAALTIKLPDGGQSRRVRAYGLKPPG
jgi:hypothetical protein